MRRRQFLALTPAALTAFGAAAPRPASPFLDGNYAPVHEEVAADSLPVSGKLPPELDGTFVRNGPNPQFAPVGPYHWFDGDGMLHGVRLRDGKASYRNRYVRTEGFLEERAAGKALYQGLSGLPDFTKIAAGKEGFKNAANTALVWHGGKLLALWEGGAPHEVKVPSLDTVGRFTFGGQLRHACTAHPKVDPRTGELFLFGYQPVKPYVRYSVADASGAIVHTTAIDIPRAVMMHDFAVTATRAVFMDLPMPFSFGGLLGGSPFRFEPKYGARFGILPRRGRGDEVKWFDAEPCYVFHTFNAHDDGDAVVLLGCRMTSFPSEIKPPSRMTARELKESATPYRWRFDLKTGKTTEGPIDDVAADFPRVNDALAGRATRFGYAMRLSMDAVHKYDFERKTTSAHAFGRGRLGGEPVFVPRPGATGEDDGWLVAYVHDADAGRSEMVLLDARDLAAEPVARVMLPGRVPFGFHGAWVPGTAVGKG
ncbi:MAG: carotenoid oxygenase family protein [Gemmataceae bacterium]